MQPFLESQTAGINGCQKRAIVEYLDPTENPANLFSAEDAWQALFLPCLQDLENAPGVRLR